MKPIRFTFNERKAVQAAARLIGQGGGEMNYLALMKLLYLADREALLKLGRPITGDKVVAMPHGPVLSRIYDRVSQKKQQLAKSYWHEFIQRPAEYVYTLRFSGVPDTSALSEAEVAILDRVFHRHRGKSEWELVKLTHDLPEWKDPKGSSKPIAFETILEAGGKKSLIPALAEEAAADAFLDKVLAPACSRATRFWAVARCMGRITFGS